MSLLDKGKSQLKDGLLDIDGSSNSLQTAEENVLYVDNLSYIPSRTLGNVISQKILSKFPEWDFPFWQRLTVDYMRPMLLKNTEYRSSVSLLRSVTFSARQGKITTIMSSDYGERRTVCDLIVGRRKRGVFAGDINLFGPNLNNDTTMAVNSAFVPRKCLFCPGMSYFEMLRYSARLRMSVLPDGSWQHVSGASIEKRVTEVLKFMNLWKNRHQQLPEDIPERGEVAGMLRRLSIAIEIIHYPPVVVIDDPVIGLEPAIAFQIMQSIQNIARRGHIVIVAMPTPTPQLLAMIDHLVVIGHGLTLYSSPPQNLRSFFCSPDVGYELKRGVDLMEWVRDIASGIERPQNHRGVLDMYLLQEKFEYSLFFVKGNQVYEGEEKDCVRSFHPLLFDYWGYAQFNSFKVHAHQTFLVTLRALHAKILERDALKRSLGGAALVGLLVGGLNYRVGNYGYYAMMLVNFPYANTSNMTALMFFIGAFIFVQQVMTVQILCRKVSLFRQEQAAGYCGMGTFALATLLSEAPVTCAMACIFGFTVYFLTELNFGWDNFQFYALNISSLAIIGLQTAFLLAVVLRKEILVRDCFIVFTFLQVLLSGFPFQLTAITPTFKDISEINPMRWAFDALMGWKYGQNYEDGEAYITPFAGQNFDYYHALGYYRSFMLISFSSALFLMISKPNLLRRKTSDPMYSRGHGNQANSNRVMATCLYVCSCFGLCFDPYLDSERDGSRGRPSSLDPIERSIWMSDAEAGMDESERRGDKNGSRSGSLSEASGVGGSGYSGSRQSSSTLGEMQGNPMHARKEPAAYSSHRKNESAVVEPAAFERIRTSELAKPLLFTRESSVTGGGGSSRLSQQISKDGTRTLYGSNGPTVAFRHITYRNVDRRALSGYSYYLENVSGQFDWGKLSCIMGAPGSGKSTLLRVLAGDINDKADVTGHITYDDATPDANVPLWQRCALVGKEDVFFPSLTVYEVITYAMELRCLSKIASEVIEENVIKTIDVLHLQEVMHKPVSKLNAGERRRLTIAEELVFGPALLLIDEPSTNLDMLAESVLYRTFREMVNESRTVVATLHQPSAAVFDLFDTILLLSKGHVVYFGPAADAVKYFAQKPLSFPYTDYSNPADYLTDISACSIVDARKAEANHFTLSKEWRKTDKYVALMKKLNPEIFYNNGSKLYSAAASGKTSASTSQQSSQKFSSASLHTKPVQRQDTNGSETTDDGGDTFGDSARASNEDGDNSGRLTFSRSTNSYGGTQKHASALEAAITSNTHEGLNSRISGGAAIRSTNQEYPSLSMNSTLSEDAEEVKSLEMKRKAEYDNIHHAASSFTAIWSMACEASSSTISIISTGILNFILESEYRDLILLKLAVILRRSAKGLWTSWKVLWGSIFTMTLIALIFGLMLGNSSGSIYNTTSFFAVGPLLIMLSNVQLISYLFTTHQVFYKDHSRGIYNNFTYWLVSSLPLYIARSISAVCFAGVVYSMLQLTTPPPSTFADTQGYFIAITVVTTVASTMIVEMLIYAAPTIRAAYLVVPAVSFVQFMFCGLFLKPSLLPDWIQPWSPSISLFRWALQGSFLNQFSGNLELFPLVGGMSTFDFFLSLYGWGGKSKWYCFSMVCVMIAFVRIITLIITSFLSRIKKGV